MISYSKALEIIQAAVAALPPANNLGMSQLLGCASAEDVSSRTNVPGFANAAMDGFAVRSADTAAATPTAPVQLVVTGTTAAGDPAADAPGPGCAIEIMTGAILPAGCDAVIPVERVMISAPDASGRRHVSVTSPAEPGRNVRRAGEDFHAGDMVLPAGRPIEPHTLMGLAATSVDAIQARRTPKVALVTTGSELLATGDPTDRPGMIADANGPYLNAAVARLGAQLTASQHVSDDPVAIQACLERMAAEADMVVTTGGVSAGRFDMVPDAIKRLGGQILFHKVAIRPGKPLMVASLPGDKLFFGLPGNPIAVAVGVRFFVVPTLRALQGLPAERAHAARSQGRIRKRSELRFFGKARAQVNADGRIEVQLLPGQESFKIKPLLEANCWAIVPEGTDTVAPGELIEVVPLYPTGFLQPV